ncbi:MAG: phosphate ABC transporter permease subunit PstC [Candidatus Thermoplasmatota archaeon]|nr:phosphate ABC transporter permease subunit PstC [Candidatus Thermoplasmatota archaeon]
MNEEARQKSLKRRHFADKGVRSVLFACALVAVVTVFFILIFLVQSGFLAVEELGLGEFFSGGEWDPTGSRGPKSFGTIALITATLIITAGAIAIAVPLGIASAIFISEIAPPKIKFTLKYLIEILAGIPSIVYGLFGMLILVEWFRVGLDLSTGRGWVVGSIILGIMALPTIVSVSEDAISAVPREFKEASYALGATKWQTIKKVVVPASFSGITAAVILGMGRAMGETMAVMMVAGNVAQIPADFFGQYSTVMPITGAIGIEMGEAAGIHQSALFVLGVILLLIILAVNMTANTIMRRMQEKFNPREKKEHGEPTGLLGPLKKAIPSLPKLSQKRRRQMARAVKLSVGIFMLVALVILANAAFGTLNASVIITLALLAYFLPRRYPKLISVKTSQVLGYIMLISAVMVVLVLLGIILYYIISNGVQVVDWEFLTEAPRRLGREGGIAPAIVGSLYLVAGALLVAVPIGIMSGIYLAEYAKDGRVTRFIRSGIDNLNATPSIVFGLFAYSFFVVYLELGFSLLTGILILGLMVLPLVIRTTEEAIKTVPHAIREGSLALGATKWETIKKVVLPPARPGIVTGVIISIGRALGESAPILFTATVVWTPRMPSSLSEPVMSIPTHIFYLTKEVSGQAAKMNAYGTAFVLLIMVLAIYTVASVVRLHFQKKTRW